MARVKAEYFNAKDKATGEIKEIQFIPPAPSDGDLGGISKEKLEQIGELKGDLDDLITTKKSNNILNCNDTKDGYCAYNSGVFHDGSGVFVYTIIPIKENTTFTVKNVSDMQIAYRGNEGINDGYISGNIATQNPQTFTTPKGTTNMVVSFRNTLFHIAQINIGSEALPYEKYAEIVVMNEYFNAERITVIKVDPNGNGDSLTLKGAIDKVFEPSKNNRYVIEIAEGTYDLKFEYREFWGDDNFIGCVVPPFTRLKGVGNRENVIIIAEDDGISENIRIKMATLNLYQTSELENLTVNGNGLKYTVHDDFRKDENDIYDDKYREIKDVIVLGDVPLTASIWGAGLQNGTKTIFKNCLFKSNNKISLVYFHNCTSSITKHAHIIFDNCRFRSYNMSFGSSRLFISSVNGSVNDKMCRLTLKGTKVRSVYHAFEGNGDNVVRWKVDGYGNQIDEFTFSGMESFDEYVDVIGTEKWSRYSDGAY